ncbi:MAG: hypothetical protein JJU29_19560 [Verrucomicrobia bacterium]|nr:hypothetical protein [Verrucomicrobiota bacterium]MCH8514203.1 hypothetical protein [Kiritimatiellia bacterium]
MKKITISLEFELRKSKDLDLFLQSTPKSWVILPGEETVCVKYFVENLKLLEDVSWPSVHRDMLRFIKNNLSLLQLDPNFKGAVVIGIFHDTVTCTFEVPSELMSLATKVDFALSVTCYPVSEWGMRSSE